MTCLQIIATAYDGQRAYLGHMGLEDNFVDRNAKAYKGRRGRSLAREELLQ